MQIFSPYKSFIDISNCLDKKRLNKQKIEIYQILNCISLGDKAKGWKNHPAVAMTRGHELFFIDYALEIADSCLRLGYKDTLIPKIIAFKDIFKGEYKKPWYWGREEFHSSHRAALLFKDYEYYSKFGWKEEPVQNYWWPSKHLDNIKKITYPSNMNDDETLKELIRKDEYNSEYTEEDIQKRFDYLKSITHNWDCECEWCKINESFNFEGR